MKIKAKLFKRTAAVTLTVGLLVSPFQAYIPTASADQPTRAEQILQSLTEAQREALHKLEVQQNYGLHGFKEKELEEDKNVSVIVQFKSDPGEVAVLAAAAKGKNLKIAHAKNQVDTEHNQFKKDMKDILPTQNLKGKKLGSIINREYKIAYNGVAMTLPANQVELLMQSDVVQAVYKNTEFKVDPLLQLETSEDAKPTNIPTTVVESIAHLKIDKLHEEGITGEGVKIGVLDTGVDYNHPDIKDAYKGGYDFIDNDNDPMETTYEDWEKSGYPEYQGNSYYTYHGTHVSGTIVGQNKNDSEVSLQGVAPDAELYAYRVLGPYGSGTSDGVIAGIERAVEDGMDVINLSLGASINDPYYPTSNAINYAVLQGVTSVVSAGNAGPNSGTLGSPGTAALALTVGASDVPVDITKYTGSVGSDWNTEIVSMARSYKDNLSDLEGTSLELVDVGLAGPEDFSGKDVNGKIAFIARGVHTLFDKIAHAKANGAVAVVMYNNTGGHVPTIGEDPALIPSFSMTEAAGLELKAAINEGKTTFTFSNEVQAQTEGDKLADFSSRGPVRENNDMKPEVVAPGVNVLSAFPAFMFKDNPNDYKYAYAKISGTSMSAPHVTGIAALLLESNPNLDPAAIKTILMNTSVPLNGEYSVFDVGAGRVSPYEAVHSQIMFQVQDETLIPEEENLITIKEQTGGLSFDSHYGVGDKHIRVTKGIHITNSSSENKTFDVKVEENVVNGSKSMKENGITIQASKSLNATKNKLTKTNVFAMIPKSAQPGVYEGYLTFTNKADAKQVFRMPFSVKIGGDGFNSLELYNPAYSPSYLNQEGFNSLKNPFVFAEFNMSAPMYTMDVIVQDGKTGNDLGIIGTANLSSRPDNTNLLMNVFNGHYYKFTGNPNEPISSEQSKVGTGHYKFKFISQSVTGKTFTEVRDFLIDIDKPTFTSSLDGDSPFLEYKPGQATYPFEIQITDTAVEELQALGVDIDHSRNQMVYYWNTPFPSTPLPMDENGKFVEEIAMNENVPALSFRMDGYDSAGNRALTKNYYFVKEGTPVTYAKSDVKFAETGEEITAQLVLDNVEAVTEVEWNFASQNGISLTHLVDATLTEAFADKASIKVEDSKVKLTFNNPSEKLDKAAAINLTLQVQDEEYFVYGEVAPRATYKTSTSESSTLLSSGFNFEVQPDFSRAYGHVTPKGFYIEGSNGGSGYYERKDWSKVGATVKLYSQTGEVFDGTPYIDQAAQYHIPKIPLSKDPYTVEFIVPGHFITKSEQLIGFEHNGKLYGRAHHILSHDIVAGDVNGDGVIDIYDALEIQEHWGSDSRNPDINFDGVVDAKDIHYVVTNYLKVNPSQDNTPTPKEEANGKTLEDILKALNVH
ncbi:S8 family serine peptidase [Sutcliffiella halmapala]|uniref:S8 family serine peptidase n=1 Tax=Sutcliffiella halmapala TaxID=79882 RepID=UPI0009959D32|nr:S8 family serine peptidase [Sutcliffiella halmapala]